ncbi:MAG: ABC transporter substrate-binding protein [Myxococcales bacterium]|nr:ABC transporter substrate-binding protein [Myxococcales bacterium]
MSLSRRLLVSAASLALGACQRPRSERRLSLGVSRLRISQPVFVAVEQRLFSRAGLEVTLEQFDTAQPLADELCAGRLDAAGFVAFPILFERAGPPLAVRVATAIVEDELHPLSSLLAPVERPLASVRELRGKRVGVLPTLAYQRWLEVLLRSEGLSLDDVTVVPIAPALEVDALASGGIDALFTGDPMATAAVARRVGVHVGPPAPVARALGGRLLFGGFAMSSKLVDERPAVAMALVAALDEAIAIIEANPEVGRESMRPWLRETERPFVDRYPPTKYLGSAAASVERPASVPPSAWYRT